MVRGGTVLLTHVTLTVTIMVPHILLTVNWLWHQYHGKCYACFMYMMYSYYVPCSSCEATDTFAEWTCQSDI